MVLIWVTLFTSFAGLANEPIQDSSQSAIPLKTWQAIVKKTQRQILNAPQVIRDPVIADYLQRLGMRLVTPQAKGTRPFTFFFVVHPAINAFSALGNFIGVHTGLLLFTASEDEFAAVLAHEIAHAQQQHLRHRVQHQHDLTLPTLLGVIGGLGVGVMNPALGQSLLISTAAGTQQNMLNYTRQMEIEADRIGLNILRNSPYSPQAMSRLFQRMLTIERYNQQAAIPYLQSHPMTNLRLSMANDVSAQLSSKASPESFDYRFIKERVRVLTQRDLRQLSTDYEKKIAHAPNQDAFYYGAALVALRLGQPRHAQQLLQQMPNHSTHWLSQLAKSEAQYASHPERAMLLSRQLQQRYPHNYPIRVTRIRQLTSQKPQQASKLARQALLSSPNDVRIWSLLATAESNSGHEALAYFAAAHTAQAQHNTIATRRYLKRAKILAVNNQDLTQKIVACQKKWGLQH